MKKGSLLMLIGVLLIVITAGYSGYLYWQKGKLEEKVRFVENSVKNKKEQILEKENKDLVKAIASKETMVEVKSDLIKWSEVISDIRKTIPKKDKVPIVEILSYSGGSDRDIVLNVKTMVDSENPYFDVADLIQVFNDEEVPFTDTFVSSIGAGVDEKGKQILSFLLSTRYVKEDDEPKNEEGLGETIGEILETAEESGDSEDSETVVR